MLLKTIDIKKRPAELELISNKGNDLRSLVKVVSYRAGAGAGI